MQHGIKRFHYLQLSSEISG